MTKEQQKQLKILSEEIHKQGFSSICFWLPTRSVGGGTFLFCELADYIINNTDFKVYYLDCPDGYAHQLLEGNDRINIINYNLSDDCFPIKEPLLIFTNTTRAIQIKGMNPKSKMVFWHWETNPVGWDSLYLLNEATRITKSMQNSGALLFHDWSSYNMLVKQIKVRIDTPKYFPVFLPNVKTDYKKLDLISPNEINIAWVGRLSHDKVNSLNNIITCFAKYKTNKIKRFHIIGDGLCADKVYEHAKKYMNQMEFVFNGTIPHDELSEYLTTKIDALFAMGTAVLEGAALGMPAIAVTLSNNAYFDDDFYFLPDTKEYCVGITHLQKKEFDVCYTKFNKILDRIINGEKASIGKRCYDFFLRNYCSYFDRTKWLLEAFKNSNFTFRKLKAILKFVPYNQIQVKSYRYKSANLVSIVRWHKMGIVVLFNIVPIFVFYSKKRETPGYTRKRHNFSVLIKNGYVFAAEVFKG